MFVHICQGIFLCTGYFVTIVILLNLKYFVFLFIQHHLVLKVVVRNRPVT